MNIQQIVNNFNNRQDNSTYFELKNQILNYCFFQNKYRLQDIVSNEKLSASQKKSLILKYAQSVNNVLDKLQNFIAQEDEQPKEEIQ